MNPYDFVPIDVHTPIERHQPHDHGSFARNGIHGDVRGRITAETPIFLKRGNSSEFLTNGDRVPIIPGTSLKGLFRSLVETVAHGCFCGKFDGRYKDRQRGWADYSKKLPYAVKECTSPDNLCIACRTFGMMHRGDLFTGKVSFQDAVCTRQESHDTVYTVDLMGPKPHHSSFYLDGDSIAGRKFYFHHPRGIATSRRDGKYNHRITPLNTGSEFEFSAGFSNLEEQEWQALLYAIVLEPEMRHKIGYAKPSGFGSVRIDIEEIRLIDYTQRYTSPGLGVTQYEGDTLSSYVTTQIQPYLKSSSAAVKKLRKIWSWDPSDPTEYHYPTAIDGKWFEHHPKDPISATP